MTRSRKASIAPVILRPSDAAYELERYSVDQAADYLGMHRGTLYGLVADQQVGHLRVGERGTLKFSQADLDRWREVNRVEAVLTPKQARRERLRAIDAPATLKMPRQRMFGS